MLRTTQATSSPYLRTYDYNYIGNITSASDLGTYTYADTYAGTGYANPHAVTGIGSSTYTYDNNGNLTADGARTNTWDYQNRMTQTVKSGTTYRYLYDSSGQRITYFDGVATTTYPNMYYDVRGATSTKHIYLGSELVATIEGNGVATSTNTIHTDHLGGTNVVTNASGTVVQTLSYYPYGSSRIDDKVGNFTESKKFTGHEYDGETGLYYMNARYQNPGIGRFVSQDPAFWALPDVLLANPQKQNSYSYADNNPVTMVDPTGNSALSSLISKFMSILKSVGVVGSGSNKGSQSSGSSGKSGGSTKVGGESNKSQIYLGPTNPNVVQGPIKSNSTWDPITDQKINNLDRRVIQPARNFINNTELQTGTHLRVTQGYRSDEEQNRLYAQGRTTPGPIVTNARGGQSYHNSGTAIDVVIVRNGEPDWTPISSEIANYGIDQGFQWGGNWIGFSDSPHFEMRF